MKNLSLKLGLFISFLLMCQLSFAQDWPNLARYQEANAKLATSSHDENRVVFMGNSITDFWIQLSPDFFSKNPYLDRGISGQTTPQMLIRFQQDVIHLHPKVVVILAGTNDLAGNTGPSTLAMIEDNLASMAQLAQANGIKVVLSSVLPVYDYPWKKGTYPAKKIVTLNQWIKNYCEQNNDVYLDYYSHLVDNRGGMKAADSKDGVHPNLAGYKIMEPLVVKAIDEALNNN
jgi:lysophospholipase L1-like esterase